MLLDKNIVILVLNVNIQLNVYTVIAVVMSAIYGLWTFYGVLIMSFVLP